MAKIIFGCGYLGGRVARLWLAQGETVYAVTRSHRRGKQLAAEGMIPLVADVAKSAEVPMLQRVSTVLFAVGYDRASNLPIHEVYASGVANAVAWMRNLADRFLYISSTGVYGQVAGQVVDEWSPCQPTRDGGKACLAAEQVLATSDFGTRAVILRLAGIYGPGRIPRAADLAAGRPIDAPADGWLNLIHVDDAARIVLLAEGLAALPRTYVVSDGQSVQRRAYYEELARLISSPPPRFVAPPPDSPAALRAGSDKRVNPRRMFAELQPGLVYPDYRAGLAAILNDSQA